MDIWIATAEKEIYRHKACSLTATTTDGELKIMPSHAPLLAVLRPGILTVECMLECEGRIDLQCDSMVVLGGFIEVQPESIIVLADSIERAEQLNEQMAQQAVQKARTEWAEVGQDHQERQAQAWLALEVALAQLHIVKNGAKK